MTFNTVLNILAVYHLKAGAIACDIRGVSVQTLPFWTGLRLRGYPPTKAPADQAVHPKKTGEFLLMMQNEIGYENTSPSLFLLRKANC